jgi:hypothetical protein
VEHNAALPFFIIIELERREDILNFIPGHKGARLMATNHLIGKKESWLLGTPESEGLLGLLYRIRLKLRATRYGLTGIRLMADRSEHELIG